MQKAHDEKRNPKGLFFRGGIQIIYSFLVRSANRFNLSIVQISAFVIRI